MIGLRSRRAQRSARPGVIWAVPATLLFLAFGIVPMTIVGYLSLTSWNGLGSPEWIGLDNWRALADDPEVLHSIKITLLLTLLCWVVQTPLSFLLGVWAAGPQRNRTVLSTVFFLPLLLSTAATALSWQTLLDPNYGIAPAIGPLLGVPDGNLLGSPDRAFYVVAFTIAWQFVPFHALLYQAGVRGIPRSFYEAAALDGAKKINQFLTITVPMLRSTFIASSILMVAGSLTYFESIMLLTGGGPGTSTRVLPLHMYIKGFVGFDLGYASVLAVLLVGVGTILSLLIVRSTGYHRMLSHRDGSR